MTLRDPDARAGERAAARRGRHAAAQPPDASADAPVRPLDAVLEALRRRWAGYWPDADPAALAADVLARLRAASAAWRLEDVVPLGGGYVAVVCAATRDGRDVVVKVIPRGHAEEHWLAHEGVALAAWAPSGVVPAVLDRRDAGLTLLLERVAPGRALDASGMPWEDQLAVLGGLARSLHAAGPPPDAVPHVTAKYGPGWLAALHDDPAERDALAALLPARADDVLLHGDLHGANALLAAGPQIPFARAEAPRVRDLPVRLRDPAAWRVIDPHAVRGDRHADVWALLDPLVPWLPAVGAAGEAHRRVRAYARAAGLDPERAARWAWARGRAEARELDAVAGLSDHDRAWVARLHATADALDPR